MPRKKPGLTLDEHRHHGAELKRAREAVLRAYVAASAAYPLSSPAVVALRKALDAVGDARNELDEVVCAEVPGDEAIWCYYGQGR